MTDRKFMSFKSALRHFLTKNGSLLFVNLTHLRGCAAELPKSHRFSPQRVDINHKFLSGVIALGGFTSLAAFPAHAAEGLFTNLAGYWSGSGTITMNDGMSERIRCKVSYAIAPGSNALEQSLRCASDSYKLQVSANIISQSGRISGTWSEATRNFTGNVSGSATNTDVRANIEGPGFTAALSLATHGNRQSVTIKAQQGATDINSVAITLRKD
jgi:hypothetical protein